MERKPISNRYVFAKVMQDNEDLCRRIIERVLDKKIDRIERVDIEFESTSITKRGVRFDVFARGEDESFEVEMQTYEQESLPLRMRFNRAHMDRHLLMKGQHFGELMPVYIIFICTYDPFDHGLPIYTFKSACVEDASVPFENGATDIAVNASAYDDGMPDRLKSLMRYIMTSNTDSEDELTEELSDAVDRAYLDEKWVQDMITIEDDVIATARAAEKRGMAEGEARGVARGIVEGENRMAALATKMQEAGATLEEVVSAMASPDKEALFAKYGVR